MDIHRVALVRGAIDLVWQRQSADVEQGCCTRQEMSVSEVVDIRGPDGHRPARHGRAVDAPMSMRIDDTGDDSASGSVEGDSIASGIGVTPSDVDDPCSADAHDPTLVERGSIAGDNSSANDDELSVRGHLTGPPFPTNRSPRAHSRHREPS